MIADDTSIFAADIDSDNRDNCTAKYILQDSNLGRRIEHGSYITPVNAGYFFLKIARGGHTGLWSIGS